MRKKKILSGMNHLLLIISILISVIAGSCASKENHEGGKLIPKDDFVSILTDVYIADGLLTVPKIHSMFVSIDSLASYDQIVKLHGYTKEDMDNTIRYYFVKKPKKLIEIYDQVLADLSEMESIIEKEALPFGDNQADLWSGEKLYSFPDLSGTDSVDFSFELNDPGIYSLTYSITLFPDDQTFNPRTTAYTVHVDSVGSGKRRNIKTYEFIKDGHRHNYVIIIRISTPLSLNGSLFDYDNHPDEGGKHAIIDSIYLINYSIQK